MAQGPSGTLAAPCAGVAGSGAGLFLRRWLANPLQIGSVVPFFPALCRRVAD